ncbi:MAG: general secretion pathway protein GspK [Thiothrix sp.]|nr:general secretion pathway protein GspK [Thiothrix sp.]
MWPVARHAAHRCPCCHQHRHQRGVALLMVIWMIVVMMSLAAALVYSVRTETSMVSFARTSAQARAFADAAAHYTVMQLFLPPDERTLVVGGGAGSWEQGGYQAEIRVVGENGLIDINRTSRELLQKVLEQAGVVDQEAQTLLDRIEDFRDGDDLKRLNGAEDRDYQSEGLAFGAKDAPFERIEELQQVLGMTPALYERLARFLSVSSQGQGINPMLAPRHILLLLAEGDQALVDDYIRQREVSEGAWVQPTFGATFMDHTQQPVYRVQIRVRSPGSELEYLEERSIRLLPGRNPPFLTYFRSRQPLDARFQ